MSTNGVAHSVVKRRALVTGASSGIGQAFAEVFAANGFDLVLTARREDRLRALAARLAAAHGTASHIIVADLEQRSAPEQICADLSRHGLAIDALVNNAGYGVPGAYMSSPWQRHDVYMQVMMVAAADLTYRLLPGMIERQYGRIVNVASLAGLIPSSAGHTLYAASKAFLIRFSESLAKETRAKGVHVTAVCPGFTHTEFHDRTGTRELVKGLPTWMWMDAPAVAREGYEAVMAGIPVNVSGRLNRAMFRAMTLLPRRIVEKFEQRMSRFYRAAD
jgi:short-subunit dehydrogenase